MSPVQRRSRLKNLKSPKRGLGGPRFLWFLIFLFAVFLLLFLPTRFGGNLKLSMVVARETGELVVSTFDREGESITNILIPGSTQLDVARQLGSWKARSIYRLGVNEGLGGSLLAETMVKNFSFPVVAWGANEFAGFASGDLASIVKSLVSNKTNLKIGDKLRLGIFALRIKNPKRMNIDLSQGPYLKRVRLTDGEMGYTVTGVGFEKLFAVFSEPEISAKSLRVEIIDASANPKVAAAVGRTIEVLGAKVASVKKEAAQEVDCTLSGKDEILLKRLSQIYSCEEKKSPLSNFDLEIRLGKEFARRY
ncbi:MAG: hypothetical protein ACOYT7_02025 [Patescibacteria group bacterium]